MFARTNTSIEDLINQGAAVIDVRTEEEFEDEHYPNARCIPVDQIAERANEIGPKDKPVVLYCASGARSAYAARILKMMGFTQVYNAGGLYDMPNY